MRLLVAITGFPLQVQRLLTVSSLSRSQQCLWWSWPVLSVLSVITCISGLGIYAVYKDCDPYTAKQISAVSITKRIGQRTTCPCYLLCGHTKCNL